MIVARRDYLGYGAAIAAIAGVWLLFPGWLKPLLAVNEFIPHGHCYLWRPGLVWLHVSADSLIALAYVGISATLAYLVYRTHQEIPFHWMFLAFGLFIIACATTHFMDVWTLWHPIYWLAGLFKGITAIASVATAIVLPTLVPRALALVESARLSEERRFNLETANEKLKHLDQLKTQFFANVSHELRTPLALILGPVEKLLSEPECTPEQRYNLEIVERNARLLLKQVNDLLDVSKLEVGKMEVNYTELDLVQLVRLMAANFAGLVQEQQISFTITTPDRVLAQLDEAKVQRILLNLLSNAFKFTPSGGEICCTLSICAIDGCGIPATAEITVEDSGPGIPPELREVIFERFRQAEGGITRRFGGTGLGLAIVKEFVELQAGTVTVDDAPTGGARFTVRLPLVAPIPVDPTMAELSQPNKNLPVWLEFHPPTQLKPSLEQTSDKPLVLVVEDNPEMNQFIRTALANDYQTATANNGQEGLEWAIAHQPDLILSDVMMPQLSGDQLVQELRSHPELDATPIILLTAKADDELRIKLLRQGVQDYLMKPFSLEELRARVRNLITIKRTRDLLQQELASQSDDLDILVQEVSLRRQELQIAYETLQAQTDQLAQANRLKDEFLAVISHELRTPLNVILGWAYVLQTRPLDAAKTARALETIERNAKLQAHLVDDLLDITRLLRNNLLLNQDSVDLSLIVQAAIQSIKLDAEGRGIGLESDLGKTQGVVLGDAARLQQIVQNLLTNAVKFTPPGGRITIRLEFQENEAILQVSDTGRGIKPEFLCHVFDYFRQEDSSITRQYNGLGLGMAITRHLVELHYGKIQVESPGEGQGTTFTVTLPLTTHSVPVA